ncbi:hypothetical protein LguiB_018977 [Lonicera macranthoides]
MILDICGSVKDLVSQTKENLRDLQSALQRRKGDLSMESSITKYSSFQDKMKKEAKRLIMSLKQMENKTAASALLDLDHNISAISRVLREVSTVGISIFQSILLFLCVPVSKPNQSKWSMVSKLINKLEVACQIQPENIEGFEGSIGGIENDLEGVFRRLNAYLATHVDLGAKKCLKSMIYIVGPLSKKFKLLGEMVLNMVSEPRFYKDDLQCLDSALWRLHPIEIKFKRMREDENFSEEI